MEIEFTIPLNPVGKKNGQNIVYKNGKPIIVQNANYKKYERDCKKFMPKLDEPISVPCEVSTVFYRKDHRRCDITNLLSCIHDCLVKYGVVSDDNYNVIYSVDGSRVFVDPARPRTEVTIRY